MTATDLTAKQAKDAPYVPEWYDCQYCGAVILNQLVSRDFRPPPDDETGWAKIMRVHLSGCDWVQHRGHQFKRSR